MAYADDERIQRAQQMKKDVQAHKDTNNATTFSRMHTSDVKELFKLAGIKALFPQLMTEDMQGHLTYLLYEKRREEQRLFFEAYVEIINE